MADLRDLIAETLAAHVDVLNRDRSMSCTCGDWLMLAGEWPSPADIQPQSAGHRRHRADAAVAVVAEWLREEAAAETVRRHLAGWFHGEGYTHTGHSANADDCAHCDEAADEATRALADALTQKEPSP